MNRYPILKLLPLCVMLLSLVGCALWRIDPWDVMVRSDVIQSPADEQRILAKARVERSSDGRVTVLYVSGTPYERGYQHGALLRKEVQENLGYLYNNALSKFHFKEIFSEAYERMRPFIPQEYIDEMHGLAHGARLPLEMIHHIHALPEIGEWGGKKRVSKVIKAMMKGLPREEWGTSCSNLCVRGEAASGGGFYTVRILDWGLHRISKLHQYPLLTVEVPEKGYAHVNIGWVGFLGAVSGMNERGITLGEMGYGDVPNETLAGTPMPFLLREVLLRAGSLAQVRKTITSYPGTNSFVFLMSDGKSRQAELYIRDRERFVVAPKGKALKDRNKVVNPIKDTVYGGHYLDRMETQLSKHHGVISPELLMKEIIPEISMKSNFQNVVYDPVSLALWVSNATSPKTRAAEAPYTFYDLRDGLRRFREGKIVAVTK